MQRYKLTIEYLGTPYAGWQKQAGQPTVQEALETVAALLAGQPAEVVGAGRTDAGVHAEGQVAHLDLSRPFKPFSLMMAFNDHLREHPIRVVHAEEAPADFHARFSALRRRYRYAIINRRASPGLEARRAWHIPRPLDVDAMRLAAGHLLGRHDFTSFRDSECQAKSPVKTLDRLELVRTGDRVEAHIEARSFLHHQVRIMMGTLSLVGLGKWRPEDVATALAACDRTAAGPTAPADGLYLMEVGY